MDDIPALILNFARALGVINKRYFFAGLMRATTTPTAAGTAAVD
jgi:hypothetical protein